MRTPATIAPPNGRDAASIVLQHAEEFIAEHRTRIHALLSVVAMEHGLAPIHLTGADKTRRVMKAKREAVALAVEFLCPPLNVETVGIFLGVGRATIYRLEAEVRKLAKDNLQFEERLENLRPRVRESIQQYRGVANLAGRRISPEPQSLSMAKIELLFGGRSLGRFTRGDLVEFHSMIACLLEVEEELAGAWLSLKPEQKERVNRIVDAVLSYFSRSFALGANAGARQRRLACGLLLEFAPDVPVAAVAAAVRLTVPTVEANARWLKKWEGSSEGVNREMAQLRAWIAKALGAQPGTGLATGRQGH